MFVWYSYSYDWLKFQKGFLSFKFTEINISDIVAIYYDLRTSSIKLHCDYDLAKIKTEII